MPKSQAAKASNAASKPPSTSSVTTRSTSRAEAATTEPLASPRTPGDPSPSAKVPLNPSAAKDFLCRAGLLESSAETCTAILCSNLLTVISAREDIPQNVGALIRCVTLILPEAFSLVCETNSQLSAISDKLDTLLSNPEPAIPSPPVLAELGEKLDKVTLDIQKAAETWQTVPHRSQTRPPPPAGTPLAANAPVGPSRAEIAKNRRIQSQGCFILVEPNSDAIKSSFDSLSPRTLTTKAEFAWNAAWDAIKNTDAAKALKLADKPRITFKAALRLPRGGIRYELGDRTQAALLSDARIAAEFEKGFGGASCKGQGATILLQCAPIYYNPEDPAAIQRFEDENELSRGDVLSMTWCKPPHKRKPEQTMAVLRLEMRSHDLADRLITEGGQLECSPVLFRKANQEPMRCLRCQKYGHKAAKCTSGPDDVCSQCGGMHRIANCSNKDKKWCVPCQSDAHCSYNRDCPSFRAECTKLNNQRPENQAVLFGPPRPYNPRFRPINYLLPPPQPPAPLDGGHATLFNAQRADIREMNRRPPWVSRDRLRKQRGVGEPWDTGNVRTAPLAKASGANTIPIGLPRAPVMTNAPSRLLSPAPHQLDVLEWMPTPLLGPILPPSRTRLPLRELQKSWAPQPPQAVHWSTIPALSTMLPPLAATLTAHCTRPAPTAALVPCQPPPLPPLPNECTTTHPQTVKLHLITTQRK
ncbi:hypothetical protein OPQ81_011878 [Rhizoctonia solani]|nr:hypothetical protein OPQ81_011878 [Rhizoctonia solani]